jgi:hypothetical protein
MALNFLSTARPHLLEDAEDTADPVSQKNRLGETMLNNYGERGQIPRIHRELGKLYFRIYAEDTLVYFSGCIST